MGAIEALAFPMPPLVLTTAASVAGPTGGGLAGVRIRDQSLKAPPHWPPMRQERPSGQRRPAGRWRWQLWGTLTLQWLGH